MPDKALLLELYGKMKRIRAFEEALASLFAQKALHGTCHLCIGEEATAVGSVSALQPQDQMFGTHRSHGHAIAFGLDVRRMMAEIFGKETGYCRGKGGSMHIADIERGFSGANGIVSAGVPLATGAALAIKLRGQKNRIVLGFLGDGATNEGAFHESLNMAALWKLPVVYACINNYYGMSTHISRSMAQPDIAQRALAYGMRSVTVDGNDVLAVREALLDARQYALSHGPVLVVENTYRVSGHSKSDANRYRTEAEIAEWRAKCPIRRFEAYLLEQRIATQAELGEIDAQCKSAIDDAIRYARQSPEPNPDELLSDVFA